MTRLPDDFAALTEPLFGDELWHLYTSGMDSHPEVSIRMHPVKGRGMKPDGAVCDGRVPWCGDGYYLSSRPNFTFDPLMHAGVYYVQEAASMFLDRVLRLYMPDAPLRMLDLCAAPGGKSMIARGVLPVGSLLVSNEPVRARAQILTENMMKYGHQDIMVTNNYARDIARSGLMFDVVAADVPCSGEGMFRKDEGAVSEWSRQNVEKCSRLQREIIADIWPALRDGGILVYSTCTFNTLENEENVRYIASELGAEVLPVPVEESWRVCGSLLGDFTEPVCRFIPGVSRGEGLFMAVLRKHGGGMGKEAPSKTRKQKDRDRSRLADSVRADLTEWVSSPADYAQCVSGSTVYLIPKAWQADYALAAKSLSVMTAGIQAGGIKGRDIVPAHALALSTALRSDVFPSVELDYAGAVSYLRRETVAVQTSTPRGYVVARYRGHALGFLKNIGNRANNLYPAEWRIRSGHTPEGVNEVLRYSDEE